MWREVSKRCVTVERQNVEASMKEKISLVFYSELISNWQNKLYIEVCIQEARGGVGW
jgi:hypothetical protein